jgi:AcrR family transcriptional regulator
VPATKTRTQAERREATTSALLDAAREAFARDGYGASSLDDIVAAAGVSKGALYHHFAGKTELFQAVYEREQDRLAEICAEAALAEPDPWTAVEMGARAFLEAVLDPEVQRIVLLDSFAALGHETVRAGEATSMALLEQGLRQAMGAGRIAERPVEPLAALLFGAICEASLTVARAEDQPAAHTAMVAELHRILGALAA